MEQRVEFVVRAVSQKETMAGLCRAFGVSRPTGYRWRKRYEQAKSFTALHEISRRPHRSPQRSNTGIEERVVELRQQYGWGAKKMAVLLSEAGTEMPVITIHRILKRRGLVREEDVHARAVERFERSAPNELWQMDSKGEYRGPEGACHPLSIVDDHSRYAVGLHALPRLTSDEAYPCLVKTFQRYGVPEAMLMDHGSLWWSMTNGYGLTWLSVRLIEQGIRLHYGRIGHPQTQGKVERFHRTLKEAIRHRGRPQRWAEWPVALEEFRRTYNEVRPHEGIGMQRPAQRYRPSSRVYQPQPADWEYPPGSVVKCLNTQGCLDWRGERWFVCEALAGRPVRVEPVEHLLLVSYQHMYVREIDQKRRESRPLVLEHSRRARPNVVEALRSPSGLPTGLNDETPGTVDV